ncbi:MAG: AbrB/MazE/SpoVT family DNA-binding domain-containing protein [Candidatus Competibacteraceae bacterium]|nr:AbrB/MazE/SpoVT family DNA-binding domain-containing protein [Candidatus Competibacteraceae bacterium]
MMASLRRSGGSLIVTIPQSYIEQNQLEAGAVLSVEISGAELRLKPARPRRRLAELLAATPKGLQRVEGWDELSAVGNEQ